MRTLFANAYVVTMDDAGTELSNGWILVDDGFVVEVGEGKPPAAKASRTSAARWSRPGSSTRTITCTRRSPGRGRSRPTSSPGSARSTRSGAGSTRSRVRRRPHRARGAGARRLHDRRSTTTTSSRAVSAAWSRRRSRRRASSASGIVASRGSMDVGESDGGLPAGRPRRGGRRGARRHGGPVRPPRARPRALDADRGRALLAVLGLEAADDGVGRARAPARPAAPHPPRRDRRGGEVLPGASSVAVPVEYPEQVGWLEYGRLVFSLRPLLRERT